ncbi:uncharacterized protein E5676_scaffold76G00120 [Cucumis melo var. makuwa]|uniref:Uncharacterized protein n=1 Tax=Cucumis melo var. makuwa TaxID=1194695 RepID=A0A5D3CA15_CUCMM|nr:uncharacterized protein E6C27_scaffold17G001650 [Cucumis melo var. makuwa]TYK08711.1 uncharacterized protein E5676_scaffold76G00120 [Cucumis melo var. makuwa]
MYQIRKWRAQDEKNNTLHIHIPFVYALEQVPSYVKFLKDILGKKRRINDFEIMTLTQAISDVLKNRVPEKMIDLGSLIIPCSIGGMDLGCALCDLGETINLRPLSIFKKLETGEVDKFLFLVDFVILDYKENLEVPIILGRLFPSTSCALIDVHQEELTMRFNDEEIKFNVVNVMKFPIDVENYNAIESLGWDYCKEKAYYGRFNIGEFLKIDEPNYILEEYKLSGSKEGQSDPLYLLREQKQSIPHGEGGCQTAINKMDFITPGI